MAHSKLRIYLLGLDPIDSVEEARDSLRGRDGDIIVLHISHRSENCMDSVTISTKYQIVIPREARKQLRIKPGQKMRVILYDNRVVLIPVRPIEEAYGSLKGIETDIPRDEEDRV